MPQTTTTRKPPLWESAIRSKLQRPYVNAELENIRERTSRFRRLSTVVAFHTDCNHCYRVKRFGHKETLLLEEGQEVTCADVGRCSICWRVDNEASPPHDLIDEYQQLLSVPVQKKDLIATLIHDPSRSPSWDTVAPRAVLVEKAFYEWLYR